MSQNWGLEKKSVSQKRGQEKNFTLKSGDWKKLWSENWDRKRNVISEMGTGNLFPVPILRYTVFFPVPTFENKILFRSPVLKPLFSRSPVLRYTFLFWSPILRHKLSLEFLEKFKFLLNFKALKENNHALVISGQDSLTY